MLYASKALVAFTIVEAALLPRDLLGALGGLASVATRLSPAVQPIGGVVAPILGSPISLSTTSSGQLAGITQIVQDLGDPVGGLVGNLIQPISQLSQPSVLAPLLNPVVSNLLEPLAALTAPPATPTALVNLPADVIQPLVSQVLVVSDLLSPLVDTLPPLISPINNVLEPIGGLTTSSFPQPIATALSPVPGSLLDGLVGGVVGEIVQPLSQLPSGGGLAPFATPILGGLLPLPDIVGALPSVQPTLLDGLGGLLEPIGQLPILTRIQPISNVLVNPIATVLDGVLQPSSPSLGGGLTAIAPVLTPLQTLLPIPIDNVASPIGGILTLLNPIGDVLGTLLGDPISTALPVGTPITPAIADIVTGLDNPLGGSMPTLPGNLPTATTLLPVLTPIDPLPLGPTLNPIDFLPLGPTPTSIDLLPLGPILGTILGPIWGLPVTSTALQQATISTPPGWVPLTANNALPTVLNPINFGSTLLLPLEPVVETLGPILAIPSPPQTLLEPLPTVAGVLSPVFTPIMAPTVTPTLLDPLPTLADESGWTFDVSPPAGTPIMAPTVTPTLLEPLPTVADESGWTFVELSPIGTPIMAPTASPTLLEPMPTVADESGWTFGVSPPVGTPIMAPTATPILLEPMPTVADESGWTFGVLEPVMATTAMSMASLPDESSFFDLPTAVPASTVADEASFFSTNLIPGTAALPELVPSPSPITRRSVESVATATTTYALRVAGTPLVCAGASIIRATSAQETASLITIDDLGALKCGGQQAFLEPASGGLFGVVLTSAPAALLSGYFTLMSDNLFVQLSPLSRKRQAGMFPVGVNANGVVVAGPGLTPIQAQAISPTTTSKAITGVVGTGTQTRAIAIEPSTLTRTIASGSSTFTRTVTAIFAGTTQAIVAVQVLVSGAAQIGGDGRTVTVTVVVGGQPLAFPLGGVTISAPQVISGGDMGSGSFVIVNVVQVIVPVAQIIDGKTVTAISTLQGFVTQGSGSVTAVNTQPIATVTLTQTLAVPTVNAQGVQVMPAGVAGVPVAGADGSGQTSGAAASGKPVVAGGPAVSGVAPVAGGGLPRSDGGAGRLPVSSGAVPASSVALISLLMACLISLLL